MTAAKRTTKRGKLRSIYPNMNGTFRVVGNLGGKSVIRVVATLEEAEQQRDAWIAERAKLAGPYPPLEQRFWAHVDKNGPVPPHKPELGQCWVWSFNGRHGITYGTIARTFGAQQEPAHRISWEMAHGSPALRNVCHKCDNPPCVRPDHLFEGSQQENVADRDAKGRRNVTGKSMTIQRKRLCARALKLVLYLSHGKGRVDACPFCGDMTKHSPICPWGDILAEWRVQENWPIKGFGECAPLEVLL